MLDFFTLLTKLYVYPVCNLDYLLHIYVFKCYVRPIL